MPHLPTSQEFLEQSSLLLEAYPDTTIIAIKYSYPRTSSTKTKQKLTASPISYAAASGSQPAVPPPATLTLKTYNPGAGICLKYRTDKAAEVGRLIAGLGKLASGASVTEVGANASAGGVGAVDLEMVDAPNAAVAAVAAAGGKGVKALNTTYTGNGGPGSGGGGATGNRSKRKGGKGKR